MSQEKSKEEIKEKLKEMWYILFPAQCALQTLLKLLNDSGYGDKIDSLGYGLHDILKMIFEKVEKGCDEFETLTDLIDKAFPGEDAA